MAFVPADERMELASSPYHQEDNIDMEFGEDEDTYLTDPHLDSMFEDPPPEDDILLEDEPLIIDTEKDDDHMQDEVAIEDEVPEPHQTSDQTQPRPQEDAPEDLEEDDILYEDDDDEEETAINKDAATASQPLDPLNAEQPEGDQVSNQPVEDHDDLLDDEADGDPDEEHRDDPEDNVEDHQGDLEGQETTTSEMHLENTNAPIEPQNQDQHGSPKHDEPTVDFFDGDHDTQSGPNQLSGHEEAGHPNTNEIPNLHPVKVHYQESEICMFPPNADDTSTTFFLSDNSLALETLDKLLAACREVLADSIGEHDELVLDVASLGLHICEDSKYATQITLAQILDVYLALSHNDNIDQIDPLYCNLSSRVSLASQYTYLQDAAQQGRTFNEILAEHAESPADGEDQETMTKVSADAGEAGPQDTRQPDIDEVGEGAEPTNPKAVDEDSVPIEAVPEDISTTADAELIDSSDHQKPHSSTVDPGTESSEAMIGAEIGPESVEIHDFGGPSQDADESIGQLTDEPHLLEEESTAQDDVLQSTNVQAADNDAHDETSEVKGISGDADLSNESGAYTASDQDDESLSESQDVTADNAVLEDDLQDPAVEADELLDFDTAELDIGSLDAAPEDVTQALEDKQDVNAESTLSNGASTNGHASAEQAVAPITPSKLRRSKRKLAQNDDELELLDFDTPENKRRRPS